MTREAQTRVGARPEGARRALSSLLRVPVALTLSSALVVAGSILATAPATAGHWSSVIGAAVALFTAMVWSGVALHRQRHRQP